MCKLFSSRKIIAISALLLGSVSGLSHSATITFGGNDASDGSGLTSEYIDPITGVTNGGNYLIETFDAATGLPNYAGSTEYTVAGFEDECAVNSINGSPLSTSIVADPSQIGVRQGTLRRVAAAPLNDETCFGYVTNNGSGVATAIFDYTNLLAFYDNMYSEEAPFGITYLGFYWGSVDTYNSFEFYSGDTLVSSLTGTELLTALEGSAGNRESTSSNVYVNIDFYIAEQFDTLVITTNGIAGEFDNIVVGITGQLVEEATDVSAPSAAILMLLGVAGIAYRRRTKQVK